MNKKLNLDWCVGSALISKKILAVQDAISAAGVQQNGDLPRHCLHNNQTKPAAVACTQGQTTRSSSVQSTQQNNLSFVHSPVLTKPSCDLTPIQSQPLSVRSSNQAQPLSVQSPNQSPCLQNNNEQSKSNCTNQTQSQCVPTPRPIAASQPTKSTKALTGQAQPNQSKAKPVNLQQQCKKPGPLLAHYIEETCIYDDTEHTKLLGGASPVPVVQSGNSKDRPGARNGRLATSDMELINRDREVKDPVPVKHRIVINLDDKNKFTDEITV